MKSLSITNVNCSHANTCFPLAQVPGSVLSASSRERSLKDDVDTAVGMLKSQTAKNCTNTALMKTQRDALYL